MPDSEAQGERLGTWLRQSVCTKVDGQFCYGQVTGYSDGRLTLSTMSGPLETNSDAVCGTIYPVVAMVMGYHQFPVGEWTYERLSTIHDAIMDRLLKPATPDMQQAQLTLAELMHEILPEVSPGFDRVCRWTDSQTGKSTFLSVQHVVDYVYYVDGQKPVPRQLQGVFSSSFSDVLSPEVTRPSNTSATRIGERRSTATNASSFFDVLEVDDDAEEADEEASLARTILAQPRSDTRGPRVDFERRSQHSQHRVTSNEPPLRFTQPAPAQETSLNRISAEPMAELEIRDLIRTHKPHLLPFHLATCGTKRPTMADVETPAAKRSKYSFQPFSEQRRVHELITGDVHTGKSPAEFVESLVSSSDLWAYPGVATRAYDFQFGSRGLSFLHFTPVDHLLRLRRQRESFINMSDYSVSAKFTPAPDPSSWEDVLAGANGFQKYCSERCDLVTQNLATSLYSFVAKLKTREMWPRSMLLTLVLWIDAQLERYRCAVAIDAETASFSRHAIASSFTPNNVELHGLLLTEQRNQDDVERHGSGDLSNIAGASSRQSRPQRSNPRKEVSDNYPPIPVQEGKEVCLKFLSKRGCPSSDPNTCIYANRAHFFPAAISNQLRSLLRKKFGGVHGNYN